MAQELKQIIESLLFVAESPLTIDHFKGILQGEETAAIRKAIEALMAEYDKRDGGFTLKQIAGGYQFRTQERYNEWIKRLIRPSAQRLSRAALETLAIIAYNQPIIRSDIEHIRGVDSGGVIRMLMERKLIRVLGRKEIPGRPLIYATTRHFLEVFELKDLKDLPTPKEIQELSQSPVDQDPEVTPPTDQQQGAQEQELPGPTDTLQASKSHDDEEVAPQTTDPDSDRTDDSEMAETDRPDDASSFDSESDEEGTADR